MQINKVKVKKNHDGQIKSAKYERPLFINCAVLLNGGSETKPPDVSSINTIIKLKNKKNIQPTLSIKSNNK